MTEHRSPGRDRLDILKTAVSRLCGPPDFQEVESIKLWPGEVAAG
ncbi:hypothetical protein [Micromonospora sp. NPDC049274]